MHDFYNRGYTVKRKQRKPDPWDDDMSNDPLAQLELEEGAAQDFEEPEQPDMADFLEFEKSQHVHSLAAANRRCGAIADIIISEGLGHDCIPCILTATANVVMTIIDKVIDAPQHKQALEAIVKDVQEMINERVQRLDNERIEKDKQVSDLAAFAKKLAGDTNV